MSAVRRADRRATRNRQSSPYARPATAPKKSPWSISNLLSYILPIRSRTPMVETPQDESFDAFTSASESLSSRGHRIQQDLNSENPTPPNTALAQETFQLPAPSTNMPITPYKDVSLPPEAATPSPAKNLETVAAFLAQKAGRPLNQIEAAGLVALINQSTDYDYKPEPFRFSSSPPTPARGSTPYLDFSTSDVSKISDSPSPRKRLSRNPNGVYRWEGGGSARPRNRYHSPAFGSPPSTPKIRLSTPEVVKTDTKRRRVGDDTSNSQHVSVPSALPARSSAPSPPSRPTATSTYPFPVSNGASPAVNGTSVNGTPLPRLRTTGFPTKPTTPAVPSPLRQSWSQSESPPAAKPTKAADFMTELIKEVTPPRKPDVSNPYQTASPVKPPVKKPTRRTRVTGKPPAPVQLKQPEPELTPQAIIEATVPKGSKRSRPPPNLENHSQGEITPEIMSSAVAAQDNRRPERTTVNGKSKSPRHRRSPSPIVIEDVVDDIQEPEPLAKRPRKDHMVVNGPNRGTSVTVEEIQDIDAPLASAPIRPSQVIEVQDQVDLRSAPSSAFPPQNVSPTSQSNNRSLFSTTKSSAPKEPSKLRFSYQPDVVSGGPSVPAKKSQKVSQDPREVALAMTVDDLPSYTFTFDGSSSSSSFVAFVHVTERNAAKAIPAPSLPIFDFSMPLPSKKADAGVAPTPAAFNWAAAGMKPPTKTETENWICLLCMLSNPGSAVDKCTICEAPRPKKTAAADLGFNWAAAGMKPPSTASGESWTCSTCMLSNPSTAVDKCTVCEAPR